MKARRFLSVALCIMFMVTLLPMNTRALSVRDLFKDESKQGGLTIDWYSAIRSYTPTTTVPSNSSRFAMHLDIGGFNTYVDYYVMIDNLSKEKTLEAYNNFDRSVYLGSETLSAGSLDAKNWSSANASPQTSDVRDCYVWGEVSGYIKMPRTGVIVINPSKKYDVDYVLSFFGMDIGRWGTSLAMNIPNVVLGDSSGNTIREKDEFIPFAFRVGKMQTDSNSSNEAFSLEIYTAEVGPYGFTVEGSKALIPAECFYSKLSLQDMQRFFVFNPDDYTLTLDPIHKSFPVQDYEYGIIPGDVNDYSVDYATGFQPLQLGVNHVTPDSGTIVIRHKTLKFWYISVGTADLSKPRDIAILQRTPTTCKLSWKAPQQIVPDDYKIRYDIYRRETGFIPNLIFSTGRMISNQYVKVGSTTDLTYTDKELKYYLNYEYFIQAAYPTGFSPPSDLVYTNLAVIEEMPSAPTDLKAVPLNQTDSNVDLKISWSEPQLRRGYRGKGNSIYFPIKEYIIYRKVTNPTRLSITFVDPQEIARTKDTSYIDLGRDPNDQCVYYVQSVESSGHISYLSSPLYVSVQNLIASTPKIIPDTLTINNGDTVGLAVQYDGSYTGEMAGTWSVDDSTIVSVEESNTEPITINPKHTIPGTIGAKVTGLKPGTTTVTFTNAATGISRDCKVDVLPAFKITPNPLTVYTDETGSLAVTYDDGYKGQRFGRWSVDDNTIASIDQNGVVTGKKPGTVNVTFADGENIETAGGLSIATASRKKSAYDIVKTVSVEVKQGTFTVTFDPNGGSPTPKSVTVRHDATVSMPVEPSQANRRFLGWYTSLSGGSKWDFANDTVTEDMTLYALWGLIPISSPSSIHLREHSMPTITGLDAIDLTEGYDGAEETYTFGGYPAPACGISDTEPNTVGAVLTGNALTIPSGLTAAGSPYFVTLTATNSEGTVTKTITVNVSPALTAPTIDGLDAIDLTEGYDGAEETYTFGGYPAPTCGISDTEPNTANAALTGNALTIPSGLAAAGSPYFVTLTATNSEGTVTKTITVNVSPALIAPTIDGPDTINLLSGYGNTDQEYAFGGYPAPTCGISDTEPNTANAALTGNTLTIPSGLAAAGSPYFVTLTATNSEGTVTKTITVNVNPATLPTIDGPDTINLLLGYGNIDQEYAFDGDPLPTGYGISPTEPNIVGAVFAGNTLTIPDSPDNDIGSYEVTLYAENAAGTTTKTVTVNIFSIDFGAGIEFYLSYDVNRIEALGGEGGDFTYALAPGSSMPDGLALDLDGTITGTTELGEYGPVSVVITDGAGNSITIENLSVHVYD